MGGSSARRRTFDEAAATAGPDTMVCFYSVVMETDGA